MMEQEPPRELNYESPRNEALHAMARAGWANASSGAEGSFTGVFWRMSNSEAELPDLYQAFSDQWHALGVEPEQVVGHFLLGHSTENEGVVMEFASEDALITAFETLRDVFLAEQEGML